MKIIFQASCQLPGHCVLPAGTATEMSGGGKERRLFEQSEFRRSRRSESELGKVALAGGFLFLLRSFLCPSKEKNEEHYVRV